MISPLSGSGQLLFRLLPRLYRERDGRGDVDPKRPTKPIAARGDLSNYLDAFGLLLDELRGTLEARLADASPEGCQPWLIPYFADLIDVRLVSPDVEGQREEVARAVSWRKRKGTLGTTAEIAERVGRFERQVLLDPARPGNQASWSSISTVLVQEGFRRVVTTVSIGTPLVTPGELGLMTALAEAKSPIEAAKNPALPAGTLDFRLLSRAREARTPTLATREHAFSEPGGAAALGVRVRWYQQNLHGVPCHPGTYQDASVRTVDLRTPNHAVGHHHPRRILLWAEPRSGFFSLEALTLSFQDLLLLLGGETGVEVSESDVVAGRLLEKAHFVSSPEHSPVPGFCMLERELFGRDGRRIHTRTVGLLHSDSSDRSPTRNLEFRSASYALVAGFELNDEYATHTATTPERKTLIGFADQPPRLVDAGGHPFELRDLGEASSRALAGLVVHGTLRASAGLELSRVAIERLELSTQSDELALNAVDSLFSEVVAGQANLRFEYSTVLKRLVCARLEASDSILLGASVSAFERVWLRFSCVPWLPRSALPAGQGRVFESSITREAPLFLEARFGSPGAGVLHPAAAKSLRDGAEDGGELGAFHHQHHVQREQALLDKLREFLPVTLEPTLIPHRPWQLPVASTP